MKAVVLAGGKGTRLRPITHTMSKHLIPIANKPMIFYALEDVAGAGIEEAVIIVGPGEIGEEVKSVVGDGSQFGLKISYAVQPEPLGIAHALTFARDFVGEEPFVVYLGDNLLKGGIREFVERFSSDSPDAMVLLCPVPDPQRFGVAEIREGKLVRLVEKPKEPPSELALTGIYFLTPLIFEAIKRLKPSWRGEYEITDAIQMLIDEGRDVRYEIVREWWKDTGKLDDLLEANRLLLEDVETLIEGEVDAESRVEGRVRLDKGAKLIRSVVRGPAIIGEGTVVEDSYIGPFTSISENVAIRRSEVENSIILSDSILEDIPRLEGSLIGKSTVVRRTKVRPQAIRLMIGDHSEVTIPP